MYVLSVIPLVPCAVPLVPCGVLLPHMWCPYVCFERSLKLDREWKKKENKETRPWVCPMESGMQPRGLVCVACHVDGDTIKPMQARTRRPEHTTCTGTIQHGKAGGKQAPGPGTLGALLCSAGGATCHHPTHAGQRWVAPVRVLGYTEKVRQCVCVCGWVGVVWCGGGGGGGGGGVRGEPLS